MDAHRDTAMDTTGNIHIDSLRIRVAGLTPEAGRQLGRQIGELLATALAEVNGPRDLGAVTINLDEQRGEAPHALARRIVSALVAQVK